MRSILRDRPLLGEALLGAFARSLGAQDLSPITARGYLHDLGKFRAWQEGEAGAKPRDLRRVTAVDLVNYRQNLLRTERLQAATINRKLQAIRKLFGWALDQGLVKGNVAQEVRFVRIVERSVSERFDRNRSAIAAAGRRTNAPRSGQAQLRSDRIAAGNGFARGRGGGSSHRRRRLARPLGRGSGARQCHWPVFNDQEGFSSEEHTFELQSP